MALHGRIVFLIFERSRYGGNFRRLSRLVKTDQFKIYKVVHTPLDNPAKHDRFSRFVELWDNIRQGRFRENLLPLISAVVKSVIRPGMADLIEESRAVNLEISARMFTPPAAVRGMKDLDKSAFKRQVQVLGLKVPVKAVGAVSKRFKAALLKIPRIKPIAELSDTDAESSTHKLFMFDPTKYGSSTDFSLDDRECLLTHCVDMHSIKLYDMTLTYENWMYDEILDAILPEGVEGVGGFSVIGHIAHLNLRENLLEYKQLIGDVLLDKISAVKTVVNKINVIDNTFRNFQMEVLSGEANFVTVTKEHGFQYEFDFSKVYWNSRLGTEHQRIVNLLKEGDVVFDMFAGVGPFAVPAAKKKCTVYANDLNPESHRWLEHNMKLNKAKGEIQLFNVDGREFVKSVIKKSLLELWGAGREGLMGRSIHVIMNLPAIAVEFLDAFKDLFSAEDLEAGGIAKESVTLPTIHCYCFSKSENVTEDARLRVEDVLGHKLPDDHTIRIVRNVAPNKEMLCVSFVMPEGILFASGSVDHSDAAEPANKKCKLATQDQV